MAVVRQLLCIVRGGHRWETASNAEGSVTYCVRCDKTRHAGAEFDPPGDPEGHADIARLADAARNLPPP